MNYLKQQYKCKTCGNVEKLYVSVKQSNMVCQYKRDAVDDSDQRTRTEHETVGKLAVKILERTS